MKFNFGLQIILAASASISAFYLLPLSVQANNLCTNLGKWLDPFKPCKHNHSTEILLSQSQTLIIRNRWHGGCLASIGNSKEIDNPVVMGGSGGCGQSNAQWQFRGQNIINVWHGGCLASIGNSKEIDNPVVMGGSGGCGQSNAQWQFRGQNIINVWHGGCLASIGNSKEIDNPVVMGGSGGCGQSNAQWQIQRVQ